MSAGDWCLLESDPGVFSALIREFGCSGAQVDELWSLDPENFENLGEIFGLIFLFKWDGKKETASQGTVVTDTDHPELFFARQLINNACGTQALLSVLFNIAKDKEIDLGEVLKNFLAFVESLDGEMKGLTLSNSEDIRRVHNSFSRQQLFEMEDMNPKEKEDTYHFVSFVPVGGHLWELDGLQRGPIDHGKIECTNWMDSARPVIQKRMEFFATGEIHFNLLAVCQDKIQKLTKAIANEANEYKRSQLTQDMENETRKREQWEKDNLRRRHNWMPFVVEIVKQMANKKLLVPAVQKAEEKTKVAMERRARMKADLKK